MKDNITPSQKVRASRYKTIRIYGIILITCILMRWLGSFFDEEMEALAFEAHYKIIDTIKSINE